MDTKDFLQFVASGQASKAQEVLNDMLSQKAFEALDIKKQQIAQTLYNDGEDIEVQDTADTPVESVEDDLLTQEEVEQLDEIGDTPKGKKVLGNYIKKRTKQLPGLERSYQTTPWEDGPMGAKSIKKYQKKVNKGIGRAVDRLTKEEVKSINEKISPYDLDGHRQSMNHHNQYAETGSKPHLKDKHNEAAKAHKAAADAIEKNRPDAEELSKKAKSMSKELAKHYSYTHDDRHN